MEEIQKIVLGNNAEDLRAFFAFNTRQTTDEIEFKFNLWARRFVPQYFKCEDAEFHKKIDRYNIEAYKGNIKAFVDIVFRGGAKTSRTKMFLAFAIANDEEHSRRYIKILSADRKNAHQVSTDIYNILISGEVSYFYPEIFAKTNAKREERMSSFTTSTGIKVLSDSIGVSQRGALQDDARPDLIWFDDIETRDSLRSAVTTIAIWDNMEEARTSLSPTGACIYTCNYVSELGNVHKLVTKKDSNKKVFIVPIQDKQGVPLWPERYNKEQIEQMKETDEDFEGERMCQPSASKDIMFDRSVLDAMPIAQAISVTGGMRQYAEYNPGFRYAIGADVGGGVGLDSSATCVIDFTSLPAKVVACFDSNQIKPADFGDEIYREANIFGGCLVCPENNYGDSCILRLKQLGANIFAMPKSATKVKQSPGAELGWKTHGGNKHKIISELVQAVTRGHLLLNDEALILEAKSYSRNDLIENITDVRLTTRHFDLLTACFVKDTMVLTDKGQVPIQDIAVGDLVMTRRGLKKVVAKSSHLKKVITNIGLTGTPDHPVFCNNNELKDLSRLNDSDKMYIWNSRAQKIERLSYTEALNTTGILTRNTETTGCIFKVGLNGKSKPHIYIEKFGSIILAKFHTAFIYITKTAIRLITALKTLKLYQPVNTWHCTCRVQTEGRNCEKCLHQTEKRSTKEYGSITKTRSLMSLLAEYVRKVLQPLCVMPSIAVDNVALRPGILDAESLNRIENAQSAQTISKRALQTKNTAPIDASSLGGGNTFPVYNLQVEEVPEYFANNILVHNCAIAWQMRNYAEIGEEEQDDWATQVQEYLLRNR